MRGPRPEPRPRRAYSIYAAFVYEALVEQALPDGRPFRGGPSLEQVAAAAPEGFRLKDSEGMLREASEVSDLPEHMCYLG